MQGWRTRATVGACWPFRPDWLWSPNFEAWHGGRNGTTRRNIAYRRSCTSGPRNQRTFRPGNGGNCEFASLTQQPPSNLVCARGDRLSGCGQNPPVGVAAPFFRKHSLAKLCRQFGRGSPPPISWRCRGALGSAINLDVDPDRVDDRLLRSDLNVRTVVSTPDTALCGRSVRLAFRV
jgi:hypothetical protein